LNQDRFKNVMAPKVYGAWILHTLTLKDNLDFFILFSSGASLLASPGQGTYVAANSFLDSFAHYRRALGLPAQTLNWGLWSQVGMATLPVITNRLTYLGIIPFTPNQGLQLMERALKENWIQVMPIAMDWSKVMSLSPTVPPFLSFLSQILQETNLSGSSMTRFEKDTKIREDILAAEPEKRQEMLESYLQEQVARVLRIPPNRLSLEKSVMNMGLDSLMALELKNRIEANLTVDLPVTTLLKGPNIKELATEMLNRLNTFSTEKSIPENEKSVIAETLEHVESLSEEDVKTMLSEKN